MSGLARMLSWLGPRTRQPIQPRLNREEVPNRAKTVAQQEGWIWRDPARVEFEADRQRASGVWEVSSNTLSRGMNSEGTDR
jgi:hypothetical protein